MRRTDSGLGLVCVCAGACAQYRTSGAGVNPELFQSDPLPKLATFNQKYSTPPDQFTLSDSNGNSSVTRPFYFSTSADADQDANGKISAAEADPYPPLFGNFAYQVIARGQPVTTVAVAGIRTIQSLPRDKLYFLNDCLVPVYSAKYVGFNEIHSYQLAEVATTAQFVSRTLPPWSCRI